MLKTMDFVICFAFVFWLPTHRLCGREYVTLKLDLFPMWGIITTLQVCSEHEI